MPIDYTDYSGGFNPYSNPIMPLLTAGGVVSSFLPGVVGRIFGRGLDALATTLGQYQQGKASQQQLDRIMQLNNEMRDMGNDAYGQMIQNALGYNQYMQDMGNNAYGQMTQNAQNYNQYLYGSLGGPMGFNPASVGYGGATGGGVGGYSPDPNDPWATIYGAQSKMYQDWNNSAQTPINYMNQALGELNNAGTAQRNEIERGFQQGQSTAQQAMAARGLTNTSAYGNMLQGWEQRKGEALAGLEGQLGQMRSGVISQFSPLIYGAQATALNNMGNALATYQNAAQGQAHSAYSIPQSLIGSKLGFDTGLATSAHNVLQSLIGSKLGFDTGLATNAQNVLSGMNLMPPDLAAAAERQQGYGYAHGMQQAYQASQPGWLGGALGAGTGAIGGGLLGSALLWPVLGPVGGFGAGALLGGLGGLGIGHSFD